MSKVTCATVNKELKRLGYNVKMYKCRDYFYFVGDCLDLSTTTMVCVNSANDLSVEEWIQEFKSFLPL